MKQLKKIFLGLSLLAGVVSSCSDDFLETSPTRFTSASELNRISEFDPSIFDGVLLGVYAYLHTPETGGTRRDDDIGHRGYDIYTDMLASDMALAASNYGWYSGIANYNWIQNQTFAVNRQAWRFYYRVIFGANSVLDAQGGNDYLPDTDGKKFINGQARALRAFAYFYLTQLYQKEYDPSEKILPIYTGASDFVNTEQVPMSDIYDLIESDLKLSIEYLENFQRTRKFQINKEIAQGLLAYAYAAQGKNQDALTFAEGVINSGKHNILTKDNIRDAFIDVNSTSSVMWGIDIDKNMKLGLESFYGIMDKYSYSYAWAGDVKVIDDLLYKSMDDTDIRRQQFGEDLTPTGKFFNPDLAIGGTSSDNNEMDYSYLRVEDFYLLASEMAYKVGSESKAKQYLKDLMSKRVEDASYIDALAGGDLLSEISLQSRIELWGEGKSYLLMKRNKETRTRGTNHLFLSGESVAYNEGRVSFLIPQSEIQNNPYID